MADLRLALAQAPASLGGVPARLEWLDAQLPDIKAQGAALLVLPELFACGYAIGDLVQERSEGRDGATAQALALLAKQHGIALHCGYAERAGKRLYNSAICFGPDGQELTHQRKLAIPPGFERSHFSPGQGCHLFTYKGFRIATLICYDAEFPETVRHVAGLGADLVLVPTALGAQWDVVANTVIPSRGFENGVFLAYANGAGQQNGMEFLGKSFISAPNGKILTRAGTAPEILFADLCLEHVARAQARLPYLTERAHLKLGNSV